MARRAKRKAKPEKKAKPRASRQPEKKRGARPGRNKRLDPVAKGGRSRSSRSKRKSGARRLSKTVRSPSVAKSRGRAPVLRRDKSGRWRLGGRFVSEKKAKRLRADRKRRKAKQAPRRQGLGALTELPDRALWPSPMRKYWRPLLPVEGTAGQEVDVSAIVGLDQSVETYRGAGFRRKPGGIGRWVSDRFYLGKMSVAEALALDAREVLERYNATAAGRGIGVRLLGLVRPRRDP